MRRIAALFCIFIITWVTYSNVLHGDWVYDDNFAVVNNQDILPSTPLRSLLTHDFWGQDISKPDSHKSYRPLTVFSFRINHALHGMDTFGYHWVNNVLHCSVTILVYALANTIFGDWWVSCTSALFFGLHPIHTEAVSSVVGRAEVLCTLFYLLAIFAFQHARVHASTSCVKWLLHCSYILSFIFATLSKETGYTVLGVLLFQFILLPANNLPIENLKSALNDTHSKPPNNTSTTSSKFTETKKKKEKNKSLQSITGGDKIETFTLSQVVLVLVSCGLAYVLLRTWLTTTFTLSNFRNLENPIAFAPTRLARLLSAAHLHTRYLSLLLFPTSLSADYSFNAIPIVHTVGDPRNVNTLLAYAGLLFALLFSSYGVFFSRKKEAAKVLWLLLFGVFSFLPASNLFFYVGTMLAERLLYIPSIPFCILLAWASVRTARSACSCAASRLLRLALAAAVVASTSSTLGWYAWRTHARNLDWMGEHQLFMSAVEVSPGSAKVWQNVGILYRRYQNWTQALDAFALARQIEPNYCELDYWEGVTYLNMGHADTALPMLHRSVGCVYTQVQSVTALNKIYNVLLSTYPNNTTYLQDWAAVLEVIGRPHDSAYYFLQAAVLLHNQGFHDKSIKILLRVLALLSLDGSSVNEIPENSLAKVNNKTKEDLECTAHMWLGAGYLAINNFAGAVEHMRRIAGVEPLLSPLPSTLRGSNPSPLACVSMHEQGRKALANLYATRIQAEQMIDTRSRWELAMILAEGGNIQAAHYQAYLVAESLAASDRLAACRVMLHTLERTKQWSSEQSYKQMYALYSNLCASSKQPYQQKDEL